MHKVRHIHNYAYRQDMFNRTYFYTFQDDKIPQLDYVPLNIFRRKIDISNDGGHLLFLNTSH